MFEAKTTEGYKLCYPGDLVINTLWAWMGAMGVSSIHGIVSPAYNVYTPNERLDPAYVDALVRIPVFAQEATRFSKGVWSSRLRLYPDGLFEIWMPVPPLEEQRTIVAHILAETAKLDALREAGERTIGLLKERRAALIAAAVTGKIKPLSSFAVGTENWI
jgi:type I restriction enzyme S subunit